MKASPIIEQYIDDVSKECNLDRSHAFAVWTLLMYHFQNERSGTPLEDAYSQSYELNQEFGAGDDCLDGFYYDEGQKILYLYQIKYSANKEKRHGVREAREIASAVNILHSELKSDSANGPSRDSAKRSLSSVLEMEGEIVLRCVSGAQWTDFPKEKVLNNVDSAIRDNCSLEVISYSDLVEDAARVSEDLSGERIPFYLANSGDYISLPKPGSSGIGDAVVVQLSGRSLGEASNKHGSKLFDKNVRTFLGRGGRINSEIIDALRDEESRDRFWYAHNGITMLCDDFAFFDEEEEGGRTRVGVINPQIVNGCQTANSLGRAFKQSKDPSVDVPILTRLIKLDGDESTKEDVSGFIAFGTNNQSPINQADLRANDPRQKHFEEKLANLDPPWFYERKRKGWQNLKKLSKSRATKFRNKPDRVIEREIYQQAWRSFKGRPSDAMIHKGLVWEKTNSSSPGLYEQVFDYDRRGIEVVFVSKLFLWFEQVFSSKKDASLCVELNGTLQKYVPEISQAKKLVTAHSVALFGHLVRKKYNSIEEAPEDFLSSVALCLDMKNYVRKNWGQKKWKPLEHELRLIMGTWSTYCQHVKSADETLYRQLKKHTTIDDLEESLSNQLEMAGQDSLFDKL